MRSNLVSTIARTGMLVIAGTICLVSLVIPREAHAIDRGQYADVPQATRDWVAGLQSKGRPDGLGKALCCSLADGQIISDQDWDFGKNTYRVFVTPPEGKIFSDGSPGKWADVPEEAVVQDWPKPRLVEHALVWVSWSYDMNGNVEGFTLRCFLGGGGF